MTTISVKAPLRPSRTYGYQMLTSYLDVVKQNFKHLILTAPGERIMIPDFGVGIRNYLFEQNDQDTYNKIISKIYEQVAKYLSYIKIESIECNPNENVLFLKINYFIEPLGVSDDLVIDISI